MLLPSTVLPCSVECNRRLDGSSSSLAAGEGTFSFRKLKLPSLSEHLKMFCNRRSSKLLLPPLGRLRLPRPHPIVEPLKRLSSTGCPRGLHVRRYHSSSVPGPRHPKGWRPRELPLRVASSLARSRRQRRKRRCSRSSSVSSPAAPLQGGPESFLPPLSTGRKRCFLPDPPSNRQSSKLLFLH